MSRFAKKAAPLCLSLALLWTLSACGGGPSPLQILDDPQAQPVYLSFFSQDSLSGSDVGKYWSDQFAARYNKQIYVNYDGASYYGDEGLSYRELLEKRLQSSQPDDLYIISAEDVLEFDKKGYWLDLSGMDFVDNLTEAALYQSTYNGKVFSLPLSFTGFGFIWNVDLLQAHGLAIPKNLDQFLSVCQALKAAGILPYGANKGYALTVPAMCVGLSELYGSADLTRQIDALNSGETPISTYLHDGFAFLRQLIDLGYLDPQQALDTVPGDEWDLLLEGQCAFICTGLGAQPDTPIQLELTGLPVLSEGCAAVYGADSRLCVNPNSAHLETALAFIEMVGTPQALDESAALNHAMSSAKNSAITTLSTEQKLYNLLLSPGQIPNQDFALHFNTWENIRNVGRMICSGLGVKEACAELDALHRAELALYAGNT